VPRTTTATSTRALLLMATLVFAFTRLRPQRTGVRAHIERLQKITPIQQFAPAAINRGLVNREGGPFYVRILAHHDTTLGRTQFVAVDERVLAGWLA
jgi:hypothetical protein